MSVVPELDTLFGLVGACAVLIAILVGVDNSAARTTEYIPPGDDAGFGPGTADRYRNFLVHNVKPTLDFNYRTLTDPDNTLALGSSLGGPQKNSG